MNTSQKTNNQDIPANKNVPSKNSEVAPLVLITFLWCLAAAVVNPNGDFPLNDDWSYGLTVRYLIKEGIYHPTGWTSMPLISQVLWGALFCVPFGFSFTALRISTLVISYIGIISFYLLIRQLNSPRWHSVIVALTLAFNPIYFALSYTYMTDVPFTTFSVLSMLFLLRSLQLNSDSYLITGALMSTIATLCRQLGLFIPIAFGLTFLIKNSVSFKTYLRATFPIALAIGSLIGFQNWLGTHDVLPEMYHSRTLNLWNRLQHPEFLLSISALYKMVLYLGFFLAPVLVLLSVALFHGLNRTRIFSCGIGLSIIAFFFAFFLKGRLMPIAGDWGNVLVKGGIGPITLRDTFILELPHIAELPASFWLLVTMISVIGSGLLLSISWILMTSLTELKRLGKENDIIIFLFFLFGAIIYFLPLIIVNLFDRYLIILVPIMSAVIVSARSNDLTFSMRTPVAIGGVVLLGFLALFSIGTTRDYLELNRVRWGALRYLMIQENVTPSQIDGGFEFNGLYLYSSDYKSLSSKSWWWVDDDKYIVALGDIPGYEVLRRYRFSHWLPPHEGSILILRRMAESKINPSTSNGAGFTSPPHFLLPW